VLCSRQLLAAFHSLKIILKLVRSVRTKAQYKIANSSFEGVAKFKRLGTTLTDQNCMNKRFRAD
jgi:hypothetical protein